MQQKLWFKAKRYGYGWTPSSWQGVLSTILYVLALIGSFIYIDTDSNSVSDTLFSFSIHFVSLTVLMCILCYLKGEKPAWRWGDK